MYNQFSISNKVTILPYINLIDPMDDLMCLVKVGLNMEKTRKSLILASFDGYLTFEMPPFLNALSEKGGIGLELQIISFSNVI